MGVANKPRQQRCFRTAFRDIRNAFHHFRSYTVAERVLHDSPMPIVLGCPQLNAIALAPFVPVTTTCGCTRLSCQALTASEGRAGQGYAQSYLVPDDQLSNCRLSPCLGLQPTPSQPFRPKLHIHDITQAFHRNLTSYKQSPTLFAQQLFSLSPTPLLQPHPCPAPYVPPPSPILRQVRPSSAANTMYWTANSGAPVWNNNNSMTVGPRGPILLEVGRLVHRAMAGTARQHRVAP